MQKLFKAGKYFFAFSITFREANNKILLTHTEVVLKKIFG